MAVSTIDLVMRDPITPPVQDERASRARKRGVRRTVIILAVVVAIFYLIAFAQIIMMKLH